MIVTVQHIRLFIFLSNLKRFPIYSTLMTYAKFLGNKVVSEMKFHINKKKNSLNILIHCFKYKNISNVTNYYHCLNRQWHFVIIYIIAFHCLLILLLKVVGNFQQYSVILCRCNASDVGFHPPCPGMQLEAVNKIDFVRRVVKIILKVMDACSG